MNSKLIVIFVFASIVLYFIGLLPVLGAYIYDPYIGYFIISITWPTLIISAILGAVLALYCKDRTFFGYNSGKFGGAVFALNIITAIVIYNLPPIYDLHSI